MKSFEDLEVFQRAYRLSLDVHRKSVKLPGIEQQALGDQIRRASKSICANVAEGYGRQNRSKAEFKRFLAMAIGSADEMWVVGALCARSRLSRRRNLAAMERRISDDCAHAAKLGRAGSLTIRSLSSVLCPPDGSGAFRKPMKGEPRGLLEAPEARMLT